MFNQCLNYISLLATAVLLINPWFIVRPRQLSSTVVGVIAMALKLSDTWCKCKRRAGPSACHTESYKLCRNKEPITVFIN